MGKLLVSKLVKTTKVLCSGPSYEGDVDQFWFSQAKSEVRTATARVLGKTDAAVRQKLRGLDTTDRVFDYLSASST